MPMSPEVLKLINDPNRQGFLEDIRSHVVELVNLSRNKMKNYYSSWRDIDAMFRTTREQDNDDKAAARRNEPQKFVVPQLKEQIDTFVSFGEEILRQRETFFELEGNGLEDVGPARIGEALLEQNLQYSNFYGVVLSQFLMDAARYSVAVLKSSWTKDVVYNQQAVPMAVTDLGIEGTPQVMQMQDVPTTKYLGNKVVNTSPYRFFPDPRLPIYRFQEGEFCADEEYYSYHEVKNWEASGMVAGIQYVTELSSEMIADRELPIDYDPDDTSLSTQNRPILITEVQVKIIPSEFMLENGKPLGPETHPVKFLVWVANDQRIVRFEKLDYPHDNFTWQVGILDPDKENFLGLSLAEILRPLQETSDWLMNSRIESVRKHVNGRAVLNPDAVELSDIRERRSFIRVKKEYRGRPIDTTVLTPLNLTDNTANNISDIQVLRSFGQGATGITDNLMGEFSSGRRSAREAGNVHANAANRVKKPIRALWHTALLPLGRDMLSNLRYGLDEQQMVKVIGVPDPFTKMPVWTAQFLNVSKADLQGNYDFKVTEGDLSSERRQLGGMILQWLEKGLAAPALFQLFQINPGELFLEALNMMGLHNVNRFRLAPEQIEQLNQLVRTSGYQGIAGPVQQPGGGPAGGPQGQVPQPVGSGPQGQPAGAGGADLLAFNPSAVGG